MSAKVVSFNSMNLDMSGSFLLMVPLYLWPMLLVVGWITVTHLTHSLYKFNLHKLQYIQNSAPRIVSNTSRYTSITPVHWLPTEHRLVFKTPTLVYKFLNTGFPKYFAPYIFSYISSYSTRHSQSGSNFLVVPKFQPSIHRSVKQFGHSFAFNAPTV